MRYEEMHHLPEDILIARIGEQAEARPWKVIALITDDEPGKPERYIKKLTERFPTIMIIDQFKGPVEGCITVRLECRPVSCLP